jgi:hypothetical protein
MLTFTEFLIEKEFDEDKHRWITVKDKQMQNQHIMLNKKDGTIAAGMGGKHNGEKISSIYKDKDSAKKETKSDKSVKDTVKKETKSAKSVKDNLDDILEVKAHNASLEGSMYKADIEKVYKKLPPEKQKKAKSLLDDASITNDKIKSVITSLSQARSMFNLIEKGKQPSKSSEIYKLVKSYNSDDIIDAGEKFTEERMKTINNHLKKLNSIEQEINNLK